MGCGCGGIRKDAPRCPKDYHRDDKTGQCLDADGNPYTRPTTANPDTASTRTRGMQFPTNSSRRGAGTSHDVEGYKGRGEDLEDKPKFKIPEAQAKRIKENRAIIRRYLQTLASRSKLRPLLVPLTAYYISYDFCAKKTAEYMQRAKNKQQKAMAEEYSKTMEEILDAVPEVDFDNLDPEDATKLAHKYEAESRKKMEEYKQLAQKKGKKSPEYARYRAYADYVKMCEDVQEKLKARVEMKQKAKRRMEELQGQRSNFGHN